MAKNQELVKVEERYPVLLEDPTMMMEALTQNFEGAQLSPWDLTRWRMAGPVSNSFADNEGEKADAIVGIIMAARAGNRGLYLEPYKPGVSKPPDCWSANGSVGHPDKEAFAAKGLAEPSGKCGRGNCAYAEWGSYTLIPGMQSPSGNAPACKERALLLVIPPGTKFPIPQLVSLPGTALQAAKRYLFIRLGELGVRPYGIETSITLRDGQVSFKPGERVPDERLEMLSTFAAHFRADLQAMSPEDVSALAEEAEAAA